ncbi:MAG TPA: CDP-glucose 4,6-dehydratase [Sumerlaeia bacterium]|nr:CDP-glucose 4,6-dehydratase [Sumerlaeia bacterium]
MTDPSTNAFRGAFADLPVLVTGHTGFKGSWLSIWLNELGASVIGYSLDPPTAPSNFEVSHLAERVADVRGDVRDLQALRQTIEKRQPRVVFHLAAQSIVLESYKAPKETFDVNVGGTVNVLEAVRTTQSVKALICVTSDKCYENQGWIWGYRENDALGGGDPYSASKAMAELAVSSYRRSFPSRGDSEGRGAAVASARAGNVVGGGDWGPHRLVPDCMRALMAGQPIRLRNPHHVRPWQHVLEPLSGYLWLAAKLLGEDGDRFAQAWNFGPLQLEAISTEEVVKKVIALWGDGSYIAGATQSEAEPERLALNWDKAANRLDWRPVYTANEALAATVEWYRLCQTQTARSESASMYGACVDQIREYTDRARKLNVEWTQ